MIRRHHVIATVSVFALVLASACSDDEQATARVTFESTIERGTHKSSDCPESGPWLVIGAFGNPDAVPPVPVKPIDNGAADQQGNVSIGCSVKPSGDGFSVSASATLSGATGGTFTIEGQFKPTGEQQNITAVLGAKGRSYRQTTCTVVYDTELQTVAAGRVWGHLKCPDAEAPSIQRICEIDAHFRFENCNQ